MLHRPTARPVRLTLAGLVASLTIVLAPVTTAAATHTVKLGFNDFTPASLTIPRGDTIKWSNKGGILDHDVKSTAPRRYFSSGSPELLRVRAVPRICVWGGGRRSPERCVSPPAHSHCAYLGTGIRRGARLALI